MKKNCSSSHVNELFIFKFFYKVYSSFSLPFIYISEFFSLLSFHPKFSLSSSHFLSALCALSASLGFLLKHEMGWLGLADLGVVGLGLRFMPLGFRF
jgi:hypothetical protein